MSKDCSAFIFRVKQKNFWPWKRRCSKPSECWLLFTHQYSTAPQKTWNFLQWLTKMHTSQYNEPGKRAFSAKIIQIPPIQIAREHVPESSWYSMPPWLNWIAKHQFYQARYTSYNKTELWTQAQFTTNYFIHTNLKKWHWWEESCPLSAHLTSRMNELTFQLILVLGGVHTEMQISGKYIKQYKSYHIP